MGGRVVRRLLALAALMAVVAVGMLSSAPDVATSAASTAGRLDRTFSGDGKATVHLGARRQICVGNAIAVQPDGKTVVVGSCGGIYPFLDKFAVVRLTRDGRLDRSFGQGGKVLINFGSFSVPYQEAHTLGTIPGARAYSVALEPDGKIVIAGTAMMGRTRDDFAVACLLPDGTLDRSFGKDGKATLDFARPHPEDPENRYEEGQVVATQPDGRIVVAGSTSADAYALARFDADGAPDPSFGTAGHETFRFGPHSYNNTPGGLAIQPDGKIVVSGESGQKGGQDYAIARFDPDGGFDRGFGHGGRQLVSVTLAPGHVHSNLSETGALALQPDGRIVVAGDSTPYPGGDAIVFSAIRMNADGSVDKSFGRGGFQVVRFGRGRESNASATGVAIQANGDIVLGGEADRPDPRFVDFALARLRPNGELDSRFGMDGRRLTAFGRNNRKGLEWDKAEGLAVTSDDKIVAAGSSGNDCDENHTGCDFAVARYLGR